MKKYALPVLLAFALATALSAQPAGLTVPCPDPIPGEYIVALEKGSYRSPDAPLSATPRVAELAREIATIHQGEVLEIYEHVLGGFALRLPDRRARALLHDPRVRFVERSCPMYPSTSQSSPGWALDRVDEVFRPTDNAYEYRETGSGVTIYIVDSGIEIHQAEFGSRLIAGADYVDFASDGRRDGCGHGSAVASTAAGATYGVAKGATLRPVRMGNDDCEATTSRAISAVDWVVRNHTKPAVLNMSWYFNINSLENDIPGLESALSTAVSNGIIVVVAANNQNSDACTTSPARMGGSSHVVTVGGTDSADARYYKSFSEGSNYGTCVTLWAPGEDVKMLDVRPEPPTTLVESGTSFATGYTSGAAALYLQSSPGATPWRVKTDLRANGVDVEIDSTRSGKESLLIAKPANACFTWSCNTSTRVCNFDASCSGMPRDAGIYRWNYGDGWSYSSSNPTASHTFPQSDFYTVSLTLDATYAVDDVDNGCVNTHGAGLLGCYVNGKTD